MSRKQATLIHIAVGMVIVPLMWVIAYMIWPSPPPIQWEHGEFIPSTVVAGQEVLVAREFTVTQDVLITIDRQFIQRRGNETVVVEVSDIRQQYMPGVYKQLRPFVIPCALTPGLWELENTLTYRDLMGRDRTLHPPVIELNVIGGCQ